MPGPSLIRYLNEADWPDQSASPAAPSQSIVGRHSNVIVQYGVLLWALWLKFF